MSARYPTSLRVLDFIREYYAEHKIPPTMIEIGTGAGIKSTSTTYYHIVRLAKDGYLERIAGIARGAIPTDKKIDPSDFMQYTMKPKVNPDDPYGGDYGSNNASVRRSEQGAKVCRKIKHKQPATMPMADAINMESGRKDSRERGDDTPGRQGKVIRLAE